MPPAQIAAARRFPATVDLAARCWSGDWHRRSEYCTLQNGPKLLSKIPEDFSCWAGRLSKAGAKRSGA
jgi:hypothetical protein